MKEIPQEVVDLLTEHLAYMAMKGRFTAEDVKLVEDEAGSFYELTITAVVSSEEVDV